MGTSIEENDPSPQFDDITQIMRRVEGYPIVKPLHYLNTRQPIDEIKVCQGLVENEDTLARRED